MNNALGQHLIAHRLPLAALVDEHECINAVVLFIGEAVRAWHGAGKGGGTVGWLATNCSNFVGLAASGGLAATASSRSRKSAALDTGKNLSELSHHVGIAAVRQMEFDRHAVWIGAP